jgi:hypothetical protein
MKTKIFFAFLFFTFSFFLSPCTAQVPRGFNYQAIARNASGDPLADMSLPVRLTIQADSMGVSVIWQELHSSVTSNKFGLINLVLGRGARQALSTVATFSDINWNATPIFIKTEIFYGGSYKTMGITRLWSVPYAMVASDLAGSVKKLAVEGETSGMEEALFEVKNKDGQTIFAVYNEGVRVYVSDGAKAKKGGFAVGGFGTDKAESTKYLFVGKDSVRIYLDTNPLTKGKKSGFAVGGYDLTKGTIQNYLDVSADSVRIYIDSDPSTKKLKGGFAVGGYDMTKAKVPDFLRVTVDSTRIYTIDTLRGFGIGNLKTGVSQNYLKMTPINYFIGHESGKYTVPGAGDIGKYNSFMGYQAGYKNAAGKKNVFIGHQSGYANNADFNVFIGNESGKANNTGQYNTFLGYQSGFKNTSGEGNTLIGFQSGKNNLTGYQNTYIGYNSGLFNTTANRNVLIGYGSGHFHQTGDMNTFVGFQTGSNNTAGEKNIFIGFQAGQSETGSSRLYIDITNTTSPLLWGDFANRRLVINGNSTNNVNSRTFFVNGSAGGTGAWFNDSDARLKKDVCTIKNAVKKVMALRGVTFYWKDDLDRDDEKHMGFIAQEAVSVIPEVVDNHGITYAMQYAPVTALLVEACKEQQRMIEEQKKIIGSLQSSYIELIKSNEELMKQVAEIKSRISEEGR